MRREVMLLQKRKLKINKKFQPLPKDEGDEFFSNGIFEFNITKLLIFIKANPHTFQVEVISVKAARTFPSSNLNELTIQSANIMEPILLVEIAPNRYNVIDGNHRLERAYRDEVCNIFAYKVKPEQHLAFLTSAIAYEDYVEYWNSK
jgi:hypothetical protein